MHDPLRSLPFTGPSRRGLILAALSALGFALTALLILLPNRTTFAATVDVGVTQTSSTTSPVVGALLTYTVVVTNGPVSTDGPVLFTNTLPANVTLAGVSTTQGTCTTGAPVTCTLGPTLAASATVTVTVAVTPTVAGPLSNQTQITVTVPTDSDSFPDNNLSTLNLTANNPTPSISSLSPNSAAVGSGAFTLTVNGAGFVNSSVVRWNGSGRATTVVSAAQLTATIPADDVQAAGAISVTVFNPPPGGGTSNPVTFTINPASTTTTITSSVPSSVFGQAVTFTATVAAQAPGSGTPSGNVTFFVNGASVAATALNGSGQATYITSTLPVTSHTIAATYAGSSNYTGSTSGTLTQTVNPATTTTTLFTSGTPSVFGQAVTFTATVAAQAPGSGTPSGNVTFFVNGASVASPALNGSGQATYITSTLPVVSHTITATYGGSGNYNVSTSGTLTQTVNPASTTTTLVTSGTPSVFGQAVTFTATVAAQAPGSGTPNGNVTFFVNGAPVFTPTLSVSGQAAYLTSTLAVGTHAITATYGGSGNYNVSTSGILTQTVNRANVTVQFGAFNPTTSVVGQPVNVPVTVTAAAPGSGTPTGVVTVTASLSENCTVTLSGGSGSCNLTLTAAGTRTLTASYGGDPNFNTGTATTNYIVNRANTNTIITSAVPPQPTLGQTLAVSYSVSVVAPGAGSPAGNVTVSAGSDSCTDTVAAGSCTLTFRDPPGTGNRTLTAVYAGNSNFNGSTSAAIPITVTLPTVQFSAATYSVNEDTGGSSPAPVTATITATLSNPSIYTITVNYATSNGSAVAGSDYLTATGVLTFTPGQTQRSFNVTTNTDDLAEGDETITLTLSSPTANRAALGAPNPATLVIADNEGTPTLRFSESTATVNEVAGSLKIFVTLSTPAQDTVTVTVTSVNGTAVAGQDFDAVSRTLTFAPGTIVQSFDVTIHNDNIYELDEVFTLTLGSTSNNATISAFLKTQTVTIQSDDAPPSVHFGFPTYAFAEASGAVTIAVTLSRPSALPAQVNYATSNGTALAGVDYQPASGTLTFAPLVTTGTFTVTLLDDLVAEDYKDLYLTLSNPVVATASGAGMNAKLTIANDDARAGCMIFPSNDVPKIIPDNTPAGITSTLTLPGPGFVITDVSVRINSLQHVFLGDLQISLVAPDGRSVPLLNNVGDKPNLLYTVFNDLGASIVGNQPPFTGVFRPNTMLPALRRLNGSLSGGVWGLRIVDDRFPDPELEQLNSWGLELCGTVTMTHVVYLPLVRR